MILTSRDRNMQSVSFAFWIVVLVSLAKKTDSSIDDSIYEAEEETKKSDYPADLFNYKVDGREEKFVKVQYDMLLQQEQYKKLMGYDSSLPPHRSMRNAINDEGRLWPNGIIPYTIDDSFNPKEQLIIRDAIDMWVTWTCLSFFESMNNEYNKLKFIKTSTGCATSNIGMLQGEQYIYLSHKCSSKVRVVAHEIGHAIGLYHEHMRHDRDEHITVHYDNIIDTNEARSNFQKMREGEYHEFSKPYDYLSIMHFGKLFSSRNRTANFVTIAPKNESYLDIIGEVETISYYDAKIVCQLYNCSARCIFPCTGHGFIGGYCKCMCRGPSDDNPLTENCNQFHFQACSMPSVDYWKYVVLDKNSYTIDHQESGPFNHGTTLFIEWRDKDTCGTDIRSYSCQNGEWIGYLPECQSGWPCSMPSVDYSKYVVRDHYGPFIHDTTVPIKWKDTDACGYDISTYRCRNGEWVGDLPKCHTYCVLKTNWKTPYIICDDYTTSTASGAADNITHCEPFDSCEHGENITLRCKSDLTKIVTSQCNNGSWTTFSLNCPNGACPLPVFIYGTMQTENGTIVNEDVPDSTKITFECNTKSRYDLLTWDNKNISSFEATCSLGNWSEPIPKCHPKRCKLSLNNESIFWINTNETQRVLITENTEIEHDNKVSIQCINDGYYLASTVDRNQTGDDIETAVCNYGKWENSYICTRSFPSSLRKVVTIIAVVVGTPIAMMVYAIGVLRLSSILKIRNTDRRRNVPPTKGDKPRMNGILIAMIIIAGGTVVLPLAFGIFELKNLMRQKCDRSTALSAEDKTIKESIQMDLLNENGDTINVSSNDQNDKTDQGTRRKSLETALLNENEDADEDNIGGSIQLNQKKILGQGSYGVVYEGRHGLYEKTPVAIKVVKCSNELNAKETNTELKHIYKEIEFMEKITKTTKSNNIIHFIDSYSQENTVYLVFELAKGTLVNYVSPSNVSWRESLTGQDILRGIVAGLKHTHSKHIIHRDLKPENIFIVEHSVSGLKAVIGDFGQAKETIKEKITLTGKIGSSGFIAPEIINAMSGTSTSLIRSIYNEKSDIFSLGIVGYYALSLGNHPFGNEMIAQVEISKGNKPTFQHIAMLSYSLSYENVLTGMLNINPDDRPTIEEVYKHPALWTADRILNYFMDKSDEFENMIKANTINDNLLEDPLLIPGGDWMNPLPNALQAYLRKYKVNPNKIGPTLYSGKKTKIRYFLRCIRNTTVHYKNDYPVNTLAELGTFPDGHVELWLKVCPKILMHVYNKLGPS